MVANEQPLSQLAMRGGSITLGLQSLKFIFQLGGIAVLSRLLTPGEVGVFTLAAIVAGLIDLVRDFGLPQAILGQRTITTSDFRTYTTISWLLGIAAGALYCLSAPVVANLFSEPQLNVVMFALSLMFLFNGAQTVIQARLLHEHRYVVLNVTELISLVSAVSLAVILALSGWGIWALVAQYVCQSLILLILRLSTKAGNVHSFRKLSKNQSSTVKRGSHILATNVLLYVSGNTDNVMIGARFGADKLAFYARAFQIAMLPQMFLTGSLGSMAVGILGRICDDIGRLEFYVLRILRAFVYALVPIYIVISGCSKEVVFFLLGPTWGATAQLLFPLSLSGLFLSLVAPISWTLIAGGYTKQNLKITILTRLVLVILVVVGAFISTMAVAWCFAAGTLILWVVHIQYGGRLLNFNRYILYRGGVTASGFLFTGVLILNLILESLGGLNPLLRVLLGSCFTLVGFSVLFILSGKVRADMTELKDSLRLLKRVA